MLGRLEELEMILNKGKYKLGVTGVTLSGHRVNGKQIAPNIDKVRASTGLKPPI